MTIDELTNNEILNNDHSKQLKNKKEQENYQNIKFQTPSKIKKAKNLIATSVVALLASMYAPKANADIRLREINQQTTYSIVEDATTDGYDIRCNIKWGNVSTAVDANNQISANGLFGEVDAGLYNISTTDNTHAGFGVTPPTYTISPTTFNIDYADGVVNTPGNTDTFEFRFNLGSQVTTEAKAQEIVDNLNDLITGQTAFVTNQPWMYQRNINGTIRGPPTDGSFTNSPSIYIIPEAGTVGMLALGAVGSLLYRRLKSNLGMLK